MMTLRFQDIDALFLVFVYLVGDLSLCSRFYPRFASGGGLRRTLVETELWLLLQLLVLLILYKSLPPHLCVQAFHVTQLPDTLVFWN